VFGQVELAWAFGLAVEWRRGGGQPAGPSESDLRWVRASVTAVFGSSVLPAAARLCPTAKELAEFEDLRVGIELALLASACLAMCPDGGGMDPEPPPPLFLEPFRSGACLASVSACITDQPLATV
jgi:hypothetical protein